MKDVNTLYTPKLFIKKLTTREYLEKYVDIDVTTKACLECPNYSKNWACPEFIEDAYSLWTRYDNITLYLTKINFTQEALNTRFSDEEMLKIIENSLFRERNLFIPELEKLEKKTDGTYLSAGYCWQCKKCSRLDDKPCRFPDKCRYSIESIGGLVADTLEGVFDEKLKWIDYENKRLPENLSLLMALLY